MKLVSIPVGCLLSLAFACQGAAQLPPPPTAPAAQGVAPDGGLQPIAGTEVIARINDQAVLACEIMWEVNLILEENRANIHPSQLEEARQQIIQMQLRKYIDMRLPYLDFLAKAKNADMKAIRKQIEPAFYQGGQSGDMPGSVPGLMKALQASDHQQLEQRLIELGTSLADRREAFTENAITMQWMREKVKVEKPNYSDLVAYYQANREEFAYPAQVRWEELMVQFHNHSDKVAAREKLVRIGNQAWNRLQATPGTAQPLLGDIAQAESEGFNADEGGLYDWTTSGTLRDKVLEDAIFTLPPGSLSPILESSIGFHILRVVERREAGERPFLEVQDEIRKKIESQRFNEGMAKAVDELRQGVRIWTAFTGEVAAETYLNPGGVRR